MKDYKFILEPYKPGGRNRYACPNCGKLKTLTRYASTESSEYLADYVGKCNRSDNCGYHYTPGNFFQDNPGIKTPTSLSKMHTKGIKTATKSIISLPKEHFLKSRAHYDKNNLVCFLLKHFDSNTITQIITKYHIGTSDFWPGGTVFWLIDTAGKILGGQVIQFDQETGSTIKTVAQDGSKGRHTLPVYYAIKKKLRTQGQPVPDWLKGYEESAEKFPIPFGLHLLKDARNPIIGLVEAPKTAIICHAFYPKFTWMAIGSLSYLNATRLKELKGHPIVLFPDASEGGSAYSLWKQKAQELRRTGFQITVSDLLEKKISESQSTSGMDMADAIILANQRDEDHSDNPFFLYAREMEEFVKTIN